MQLILGTTAQSVPTEGRARPVIQNLGPGKVYLDTNNGVTTSGGLQLPVGAIYEFHVGAGFNAGGVWLVSDAANTDVRIIGIG